MSTQTTSSGPPQQMRFELNFGQWISANDPKTCPEMQTDHDKAEAALLEQNRLSKKYKAGYPPPPYKIKRKGNDFKRSIWIHSAG